MCPETRLALRRRTGRKIMTADPVLRNPGAEAATGAGGPAETTAH
jgi:hypothetical protein